MYYIQTSLGEIEFDLDNKWLDNSSYNIKGEELKMLESGWDLLNRMYKLDEPTFNIVKSPNGQSFIQFFLSDSYYGIPEYQIYVRN